MTGNDQQKICDSTWTFLPAPRENPWINRIERQPSAAPHHDWNERIYDQCYRPNAYSRLLDSKGMIVDIYNNYLSMSFNLGRHSFMARTVSSRDCRRIIESDAESCRRFGGMETLLPRLQSHYNASGLTTGPAHADTMVQTLFPEAVRT